MAAPNVLVRVASMAACLTTSPRSVHLLPQLGQKCMILRPTFCLRVHSAQARTPHFVQTAIGATNGWLMHASSKGAIGTAGGGGGGFGRFATGGGGKLIGNGMAGSCAGGACGAGGVFKRNFRV